MTTGLQPMPTVVPQPSPVKPAVPRAASDPFVVLAQVPVTGGGGARMLSALPSALAALRANMGRTTVTHLHDNWDALLHSVTWTHCAQDHRKRRRAGLPHARGARQPCQAEPQPTPGAV